MAIVGITKYISVGVKVICCVCWVDCVAGSFPTARYVADEGQYAFEPSNVAMIW